MEVMEEACVWRSMLGIGSPKSAVILGSSVARKFLYHVQRHYFRDALMNAAESKPGHA